MLCKSTKAVRTYSKCINFHLCSKLQTVVRLKLNHTNVMVIDINQLCCCVVYENLLPKVFVATPVTHNCVVSDGRRNNGNGELCMLL